MAFIVARQILIMFIYLVIGFTLFRTHLISKEGSKALANLLLYCILPCVVVKSFITDYSGEKAQVLFVSLIFGAIILLVSIIISRLVFKNPIDAFSSSFSNAGFMGFPLITAALGEGAVFYAAGFVAILNALQWTYGQAHMSGDKSLASPKAIVKNPLVISFVLGLLVFYLRVPVPGIVTSVLSSISGMNAPVAMIILGIYLAQTDLKGIFTNPHLYVISAMRLLVIPFVTILLALFLKVSYATVAMAVIIANAAPIGSNVAVYAQKLGLDYPYAVQQVCLSTILSLATLPLMIQIASLFW